MRFLKWFLMLGAMLIAGSAARADQIRVTAYAVFQPAAPDQQFIFSSTFLYELDTSQLVPGTMSTLVTDTLGGTPYRDWVPKPNFHGPSFTYFDPDLDQIQLLFGLPGEPVVFPAVGSYPFTDIHLACVTQDCAQHFGPDVLFAVSGELRTSAVPEPEAAALLASGALLGMALLAAKSGRTRRFSLLWP